MKVQPINKVKRFSQQQKKYVQFEQPAAIKAYNENMGGVDRSDQNIGYTEFIFVEKVFVMIRLDI